MAGFNLNRSHSPDNALKERQINEMISMYGVEMDFLFTEKMNVDKIMMDFSHLKLNPEHTEKLTMLPEESAQWDGSLNWDVFGLNNQRTVNFFCSKLSMDLLFERFANAIEGQEIKNYKQFINSLMVLPGGTVLEITDIDGEVEGINNMFLYSDDKSVYKFVTRVYNNSKQNVIETKKDETSKVVDETFENIDDYFASLDKDEQEQNAEGQKISNTDSVFGSLG